MLGEIAHLKPPFYFYGKFDASHFSNKRLKILNGQLPFFAVPVFLIIAVHTNGGIHGSEFCKTVRMFQKINFIDSDAYCLLNKLVDPF